MICFVFSLLLLRWSRAHVFDDAGEAPQTQFAIATLIEEEV